MKMFTVTLVQDDNSDDLILPLPQELLDDVRWNTGDTIEWIDSKDGTWSLKKKVKDYEQRLCGCDNSQSV